MTRRADSKKRRHVIAADEIARVFDDACIDELAKLSKLPRGADIAAFARGIREAARIYARDALIPNDNELHKEIAELQRVARSRKYERVADLLRGLSPRARLLLEERGARPNLHLNLPSPEIMRDEQNRDNAIETILMVTEVGGRSIKGRLRPSGKHSCSNQWRLHAPDPRRHFSKRDAERWFARWLRLAWLDAANETPARTANHDNRGPFARLLRECLQWALTTSMPSS